MGGSPALVNNWLTKKSHRLLRGLRVPGAAGDIGEHPPKVQSVGDLSRLLMRRLAAEVFCGRMTLMQIKARFRPEPASSAWKAPRGVPLPPQHARTFRTGRYSASQVLGLSPSGPLLEPGFAG